MSYLYLLLTAAIWGFAFVAQRMGNESLDPFSYNALRFCLGAVFIGLIRLFGKRESRPATRQGFSWQSPVVLGLVLFVASSLQQCGMLWTSAGSAGFITGLYVVVVPLLGLARGQKTGRLMWISSLLAVIGLGLINDFSDIQVSLGNLLVLIGAFFWAGHVQMIDKLRTEHGTLDLAFSQYSVTALLSLGVAIGYSLIHQPESYLTGAIWEGIGKAAIPIAYGGIFSVGIAFSLQAYAQKRVPPARAAVILCSEAVFALFGGWWLLNETITLPMILGAVIVSISMLIAIRL